MRAAAVVGALVGALCVSASASAWEERVLHQDHLTIDQPVVELRQWMDGGGGPAIVELRGSITSHVDGSTFDALSRWNGDTRLTSDDPWVTFPEGTRIVEEDPAAHRYVVAIPRRSSGRVELLARRIAHEHFLTPGDLTGRTTGAIEVRLLERVPVATPVSSTRTSTAGDLPLAAYLAGGAGAPLLLVLLFGVAQRRRRRPDRALVARARKAVRAIDRETERLGPAFADVAGMGRRMLDGVLAVQRHLEEVRAALRRTRGLRSPGASERRADLHRAGREALDRLACFVDRLEGTATRLAAQTASHAKSPEVDALLAALDSELSTAVSADDEARAA